MADVQATLQKYLRNAGGAAEAYKAGVRAVTESPTAKAARHPDRYLAGVQRAVDDGRWAERLTAVTLADWQTASVEKGARRLADGVKAAEGKMNDFLGQLLPHTDRVKAAIREMPKGSEADSDARMLEAVRMMRQFRFRRRK